MSYHHRKHIFEFNFVIKGKENRFYGKVRYGYTKSTLSQITGCNSLLQWLSQMYLYNFDHS